MILHHFQVVNSDTTREKFVNNIVQFVKEYGFDGFDVDWEYPTQRGGSYSDRVSSLICYVNIKGKPGKVK